MAKFHKGARVKLDMDCHLNSLEGYVLELSPDQIYIIREIGSRFISGRDVHVYVEGSDRFWNAARFKLLDINYAEENANNIKDL